MVPKELGTLLILGTVRGSRLYPWEPWFFPAPIRIYELSLVTTSNSPTSACFSASLPLTLLKSIMYFVSTSPSIFLVNSFLSLLSYHSTETSLVMVTPEHVKSNGQFSVFTLICPSSCLDKVGHSLLFRNTFFPLGLHVTHCFWMFLLYLKNSVMPPLDGFSALGALLWLNNPIQTCGSNFHLYGSDLHSFSPVRTCSRTPDVLIYWIAQHFL